MDRRVWSQFERKLQESVEAAVSQLMSRQRGTFYCVAFHEFYAELDGPIAMPLLAASTEESIKARPEQRWSSPDWKWSKIRYVTPELRKLHRAIEKHAVSGDEPVWQSTHERFMDALIKVARQLTRQLQQHSNTTRDFAVLVFTEGEEEVQVLQECLTAARFRKLFPELQGGINEAQQMATRPVNARLEAYRADIYRHQSEILKMGQEAIPFLCDVLRSEARDDWVAADLLAKIGVADPTAIRILKERTTTAHRGAQHDAIALAFLGETEFLLGLAANAETRDAAVQGLGSLYSVWIDWCQQNRRLDYQPMERLLTISGCKAKVKGLYSGSCEIGPDDVNEALRGLDSKHAVIREHAVSVLGNRKLGAQAAKRILPAIAGMLQDKSATVRRLAILSLGRWKKAAAPFVADVKRLARDPDATVADYAKRFVKEMS